MWVCAECAKRQGLEWGAGMFTREGGACGATGRLVPKGEQREWHPAAHKDGRPCGKPAKQPEFQMDLFSGGKA